MSHVPRGLLDQQPARSVDDLATPLRTVLPSTPCWQVDEAFRTDPDLFCLAVVEDVDGDGEDEDGGGAPRAPGLVSRAAFLSTMSGRFGYGRSLHARTPVAQVADRDVLVVDASTSVARAAELLLARDRSRRFSEVLVRGPGRRLRLLEAERVFRALSAQLAVEALTDPVTGVANRAHFMARLEEVCAGPGSAAVVFVDLDGFKAVNDSSGHAAGDQVLRCTAQRLRSCADGTAGALVARLGGDEFALLLPGAGRREADAVAVRLQAELGRPHDLGGRVLPGRASAGVAVCTALPAEPRALLHEADLAMFRAKQAGGQRSEVVDASRGSAAAPLSPDFRAFEEAAALGELEVHYQPIVEVATGRLRSLEALVRWRHPERGLLPPGAFLDDAGAAGYSAELDVHVLRTALAQHARWAAEHGDDAPAHLNVNLSVAGLLMPGLPGVVLRELARAGVAPGVLRLELPEVATAAHVRAAAPTLAALRAAGVAVTLDDVGSGAAGLSHLSELHVDGLKIDRGFVEQAPADERAAVVVRTLVDLAHGLGVPVTAEGVEGPQHLALLRGLAPGRCLLAQGSAVSPPLHPDDVPALWARTTAAPAPPDLTGAGGRWPTG